MGPRTFMTKGHSRYCGLIRRPQVDRQLSSGILNCLIYYCDMLQDMHKVQMWARAAQYNSAGRELETRVINYETRDHEISSALRSVLSARYQQYPQYPQFASFESLTAVYPSFPFFSSLTKKLYSPSKQWGLITHCRAIYQIKAILTLIRCLTVLALCYSLLLASLCLFFSLSLGNSSIQMLPNKLS